FSVQQLAKSASTSPNASGPSRAHKFNSSSKSPSKIVGPPGTVLSCGQCNYTTLHRSAMTSHTRTHTGEKPYACTFCSYRSSQSGNLATHLKTHTGEKPFACDRCPYRSSQRIHLERHVLTHQR
ncbi:Zinc finger C2H2-type, partial [Trinorchestia longiramus]